MRAIEFLTIFVIVFFCLSASEASEFDRAALGQKLAFARTKGNCLACHVISGGRHMGDIGPPLKDVGQRYSSRSALRDKVWDATATNPNSLMPPFGRHEILTAAQIEAIIDFLLTL